MNIIMKNVAFRNMDDIEDFLSSNERGSFEIKSREDRYSFITETLVSIRYRTLRKKDRGLVLSCLRKATGYGEQQMKRLVSEWKTKGLRCKKPKLHGATIPMYATSDIALLIKTDVLHRTPNGNAVQRILKREFFTFGKKEYENIARISVSHIYNIRKTKKQYLSSEAVRYSKTNPVNANIGERRKPTPNGKPGFLRIDSVHQGDFEGEKGVYHVNVVDEILQWEIVGSVPQITDEYMIPLLEKLLEQFPYHILNFHSDNGSEYINRQVASMLEHLRINQTKSRSRHSNDNALAEGKNGSIIRKHMGRNHIPKKNAYIIENFYENHFNVYLNYHRPSAFATDYVDKRGKIKKKYENYMTPYERLKSLPSAQQYLKTGMTFEKLDKIAYALSDNEFAENMKKAKNEMMKTINN